MTSTVTRSEKWVHSSAKECLEKIKVARQRALDSNVKHIIEQIETLKKKPIIRFFFYPKLPKENTPENALKWMKNVDNWFCETNSYWYDNEQRLLKLMNGTDPDMGDSHLMNLSIEDSTILEQWLKFE